MSNQNAKIIGIAGSGRRQSNSKRLLRAALDGANDLGIDTELIDVLDYRIHPCTGCNYCLGDGVCCIVDDMTELYQKVADASALIVAAPVYFYGVPAPLKTFIDRFQAIWAKKAGESDEQPQKPGGYIGVAGSKGAKVFDGSILTVKYFFLVQGFGLYNPHLYREFEYEPKNIPERFLVECYSYGDNIARLLPG
jgi:multimeric flavodoxin WrbA